MKRTTRRRIDLLTSSTLVFRKHLFAALWNSFGDEDRQAFLEVQDGSTRPIKETLPGGK